ncbi:choice-of-anchor D domain-containing protein [Lacinutrix sp. WUR7]|uniref:choice-of-anchor D domain-containing protein n=1 Tax=Lacinutrix sp. WUR7 TaxID=2653681 RepID=UPI00193CB822|nr:choice-of-anchor D domain-containing protein [Lacinutrix sp. WUR7]QRM88540.1 choice-of-anchor D domain-containing protein [Lacinutrix sp. WUR7]
MKKKYSLLFIAFLCAFVSGFGQTYNQITTVGALTDGNYLIVGDGYTNQGLMKNTTSGSVLIDYTTITSPGATITTGYTAANVFIITVSGGNITIYNANEGYASWGRSGATANDADFYNGTVANTERWTPTVSGGLWTLANVSNSARMLQWNNGSPRFVAYTSNQVKLKLYKLAAPASPNITATPTTITGLDYVFGTGPSPSQSFTIEGALLTNDIVLTPPTNYEISNDDASWVSNPSTLTVSESGGNASQTIYVRLKSGLSVNNYDEVISATSTGATDVDIDLEGEVSAACSTPSSASNLLFSNITASAMDVAFTTSGADNYLVIQSTTSTLSVNPTDTNTYIVGNSLGGGTIVYNGSGNSFTDSGLSSITTYYYFVFAYNDTACGGGPLYATSVSNNDTTISGPCFTMYGRNFSNTSGYTVNSGTNAKRLASGSSPGSIFTDPLPGVSGDVTVQFNAEGWDGDENQVTVTLNGVSQFFNTIADGSFNVYSASFTGVPANSVLEFSTVSGKRITIELVELYCIASTPEPEIEIQGNSTEIVNGATTPNALDDTYFGNVAIAGGTAVHTFTIYNTGTADLTLTNASPYVTIGGANAGDFTLTANPSSPISDGGNTTFSIEFDPSGLGARQATISIANDDGDENPYTFDIEGNGSNSSASDIISDSGYTYTSNIPYINFQNAGPFTNTTGSVGVYRFIIQDGGASTDTDALGTELTDITFNVGTAHINYIRNAGLFNGNAMRANNPAINTAAGTITFSGLSGANFTAPDNGTLTLTLRVSFNATVSDNEQLQFTISNATANSTGSVFASTDAGGANSSIIGDRNRIEVTADRLNFLQQPSTTSTNATMTPAVQVEATDINTNIDLDWTGNISITSTGTMTGDPITQPTASSIATFNSVVHTVSGTGFTLTASASGLLNGISSPFDIILFTFNSGDFRPKYATDFSYNGDWEYFNGSAWVNVPDGNAPQNTSTTITRILIDQYVTGGGSASNNYDCDILVMAGGTLELLENDNPPVATEFLSAGNTLEVQSTAELIIRGDIDLASTTNLIVRDGAKMTIDQGTMTNVHPIWDGVEKFEGGSMVEINDWDWGASATQRSLINVANAITNNDNGYKFGNLYFNPTSLLDHWTVVGSSLNINVTENDFEINNNSSFYVLGMSNRTANISSTYGGNILVTDGAFTFGGSFSNDTFDQNFLVLGNVTVNSNDDFYVHHAFNGTPTVTAGNSPVIIEGNLEISSTVNTVNSDVTTKEIIFSGDNSHTIEVAPNCSNVPFVIESGDTATLLNENLKFTGDSSIEVESGAIFDFSFNGTTALEVQDISGARNRFTQLDGATLFITHPQGIWDSSTQGNVEDFAATNTSYGQTATFHYVGRENQVTGDALTTGSTGKLVYVNLIDNTKTLNLSNNIGIANAITLDSNGGKLEIQQGIVIGTNTGDFSGSGRLVMTDGEYRISTITNTQLTDYLPQLSNYSSYSLTGGIVHLNGTGTDNTQILSGVPNYVNLSFSGSNVLEGLPPLPPGLPTYKGISSAASVSNNITISEDAIVDIKNWSLGGSGTNLIMEDQGRFIMAGAGTKPDATGNYSFEPNTTIEFNSNGGFESVRLSNPVPDYANIVVSGDNVGTIANGSGPNSFIQFQSNGSFTVTGTGTFKQSNTNGFSGLANTSLSNANSPIITLLDNSTIEYQGANQNITPFSPEYKNVTISGTGIKTLGNPTNILVGEDLNMVASALTINSPEVLTVDDGVIVTGGDLTIEDSGSLIQINDTDTNSGPITMKRNANIRKLDYVYWSSPVDGFSINDVYGATTPTNRIYRWNPTIANPNGGQGNWVSAAGETMQRGVGYIVRGPESYTTTAANITSTFNNGKPFNGEFTVDVFRGSDEGEEDDDWNLIGNPYPSAINALSFLSNTVNTNVIDGFVNIWTHGNLPSNGTIDPFYDNFGSNYTANDYITHNGTGTTNGPSGFNGDIAAGQSFMVNMLNTSNDKVEFKNDMRNKAYVNSDFFRNEQVDEKHRIWLDLVSENASTTRILVGYVDHATQQRDRLYDAITDNQNFYSLIDNENFVIQGRALPFDDADSIPLGLHVPSQNNHTIAIAAIDGLFETENQTIYLKDNALGFIHNLSEAPYTFTSETGEHNDRFEIVFKETALSINENELNSAFTMIEQPDGTVKFSTSNALQIKNVKVYDVLGRLLYNLNGNSSTEIYTLDKLSQAAYLAKVTLSNDVVITKKAIKRN